MTDVPRRSYPLVVPPPGGFEDAVRRGRRVRRRRALGGTSGAALALVGVLTYSTMGGGPKGTTGLEQTQDPPVTRHTAGPGPDQSLSPEPTLSPAGPRPSGPSASSAPTAGPTRDPSRTGAPPAQGDPPARPPRPTRDPDPEPGQPYAKRAVITEHRQELNGNTVCLADTDPWCAYADVRITSNANGTTYTLVYALCRSVDRQVGTVGFNRRIEVEFTATDKRGDEDPANDDTVWTYSKGQRAVLQTTETRVDPGNCVEWTTPWDGYDDYGYTPPAGNYVLRARSTGTSDAPLETAERNFTHA